MYVLAILNAIRNFEISSDIKAFPDYRSEGVVVLRVETGPAHGSGHGENLQNYWSNS